MTPARASARAPGHTHIDGPQATAPESSVDTRQLGAALIAAGAALALLGLALRFGLLSWFGRLPGDLRFEGEHTRVYVPLASLLLVSAALTVLVWLWRRSG